MTASASGPLLGLRVVEFESIGPGPYCAMLLSDLGAEVLRIGREGGSEWPNPVVDRGRAEIRIDIRTAEGRERCLVATDAADVVVEGFRPGVMERLGLGPDVLLSRNPRLVYGRMTGWGQQGPLAGTAGHDINYIARSGALAAIGKPGDTAIPPLNLVGDFGGGSLFLAFGIMAALWERARSGLGQVIDAAIVDGVTSMMSMFAGLLATDRISLDRDRNFLAGCAPFYRCYKCADGREVAIGAIEPHFYRQLLEMIGAPLDFALNQNDPDLWRGQAAVLADIFSRRTSIEWQELLQMTDVCFAPVLSLEDCLADPHLLARSSYIASGGNLQTAPAPRFSRTPGAIQSSTDGASMIERWR